MSVHYRAAEEWNRACATHGYDGGIEELFSTGALLRVFYLVLQVNNDAEAALLRGYI